MDNLHNKQLQLSCVRTKTGNFTDWAKAGEVTPWSRARPFSINRTLLKTWGLITFHLSKWNFNGPRKLYSPGCQAQARTSHKATLESSKTQTPTKCLPTLTPVFLVPGPCFDALAMTFQMASPAHMPPKLLQATVLWLLQATVLWKQLQNNPTKASVRLSTSLPVTFKHSRAPTHWNMASLYNATLPLLLHISTSTKVLILK